MKIKTKLTVMMVVMVSIFIITLCILLFQLKSQSNEMNRLLKENISALSLASNLHINGLQSGQAIRNILLNPTDAKASDTYHNAVIDFHDDLKSLSGHYAARSELQKLLDELSALWNESAILKEQVYKLVGDSRLEEAKQLLMDKETAKWREAKKLIFMLEAVQKQELQSEIAASTSKAKRAGLIASTLLVLVITVASIASIVLISIISIPLKRAEIAAEQIAAGDLTVLLSVKSDDEIGAIGQSINHIAKYLSDIVAHITEVSCAVASASVQLQGGTERITVNMNEIGSQMITLGTASEEMAATSADIAIWQHQTRQMPAKRRRQELLLSAKPL